MCSNQENKENTINMKINYRIWLETNFCVNNGNLRVSVISRNDLFHVLLNNNENNRKSCFDNLEDAINFYSNLTKEIIFSLKSDEKDINQTINNIKFDIEW